MSRVSDSLWLLIELNNARLSHDYELARVLEQRLADRDAQFGYVSNPDLTPPLQEGDRIYNGGYKSSGAYKRALARRKGKWKWKCMGNRSPVVPSSGHEQTDRP